MLLNESHKALMEQYAAVYLGFLVLLNTGRQYCQVIGVTSNLDFVLWRLRRA